MGNLNTSPNMGDIRNKINEHEELLNSIIDKIQEVIFDTEVCDWDVDKAIPATDSDLYQNVIRGLLSQEDDIYTQRTISVGDRYFQVDVRDLMHGKKTLCGYLVEFIDRTSERNYYNAIEEYNTKLEKDVEEKTEHILYIKDMMVLGMAEMVESRDSNTGGHIKRTSEVVHIFADRLMSCKEKFGLTKEFLQLVVKAAPMHDLGKVAIDDVVLRKPGKYTDEEYAAKTPFGKLIAPGVMSFMSVWAKYLEADLIGDALIAGKSTRIEWHKPVFAEDVLTGKAEITKLESRNEKNGLVEITIHAYNQHGELVLSNVTEAVVKKSSHKQ